MEQNKVLMIIVSVAIFFAAVIGIGVALLYPGQEATQVAAQDRVVREFDPIEYVRRPETAPLRREGDDPVIIIYGDRDAPSQEEEVVADVDPIETEPQERTITERPARPAPEPAAPARETAPAPTPAPAPAPTRQATPAPAPAPRPAPQTDEQRQVRVTEYWIQLIASPSRDRVQQAEGMLADHNLGGRVTTRDVDGELFYRLRIGPYNSRSEAEGFLETIRRVNGFEGAFISEEYPLRTVSS